MFPYPFQRKINPATVPTLFNYFLDHLLAVDLELSLV
jgi:hypothetical protein